MHLADGCVGVGCCLAAASLLCAYRVVMVMICCKMGLGYCLADAAMVWLGLCYACLLVGHVVVQGFGMLRMAAGWGRSADAVRGILLIRFGASCSSYLRCEVSIAESFNLILHIACEDYLRFLFLIVNNEDRAIARFLF
ncbi:hypothetical protein Dimus_025621 [Dionaea muscipula]